MGATTADETAGLEYDCLAGDCHGHLALFSTAGGQSKAKVARLNPLTSASGCLQFSQPTRLASRGNEYRVRRDHVAAMLALSPGPGT